MDWLLYVVAAIFCLLGIGCLILVVIQMPGTWVMFGLALIIEFADGLYLDDPKPQTFQWWLLGAVLALLLLGELLEFIAGVLGAKHGGSTRRGMIGSLIGGIVGAIALTAPLAFLPVVGTLIGAVIGTFAGAIIGEMTAKDPLTVRQSLKPATGAAIGRILGTVGKMGVAVVAWLALSVAAFVP